MVKIRQQKQDHLYYAFVPVRVWCVSIYKKLVEVNPRLKMFKRKRFRIPTRRGLKGARRGQEFLVRKRIARGRARRVFPVVVPGRSREAGFFGRFGRGGEAKFLDQDIDDASIAANGTIFTNGSAEASLLRIAEGNGESQRIGRKITVRQINWRFTIMLPEGDGLANPKNSTTIRVILYLDKQANGAAATVTDILETDDWQSFNNLANSKRFRTLMDRTYDVMPKAGGGNGTTSDWAEDRISDSLYKKVNIPIEYDNSAVTGALATIRSNNINMLILSDTSLDATFESKMRIRYTDI